MGLSGQRTFVGFGFGPIQAGLFLLEAFRSGSFGRLVVAYRRPEVIAAVRRAGGKVVVNVAHRDHLERAVFGPVEILDVNVAEDRAALVAAVAEAQELSTALSSVRDYCADAPGSVHQLLAEGFRAKLERGGPAAVVYAAENHTEAAELLAQAVAGELSAEGWAKVASRVGFLDTVINKMSGLVTDPARIAGRGLVPLAPGLPRAFLVEAFNRILVAGSDLVGFERNIAVFEERSDLRPFEEAKLYGHNAAHALLAYLGGMVGATYIHELTRASGLLEFVRAAYLEESGGALIRRHRGLDRLFTADGYRDFADDLLARMTNPLLGDTVERVGRDAPRKLGWNDRLVGTMRLALDHGILPRRFAFGVAAALAWVGRLGSGPRFLRELWARENPDRDEASRILELVAEGTTRLERWREAGFPPLDGVS